MNIPRYNFSKEVRPDLLNFLKVAHENQSFNKNCDMQKYKVWKNFFPLNASLKQELLNTEAEVTIIDLSSDDEIRLSPLLVTENRPEREYESIENSNITDIVFVIKENLETLNDLSDIAKQHLCKCKEEDLGTLFEMLEGILNAEEVFYLGFALQSINSTDLIIEFCNKCLLSIMRKEYCEKIPDLISQLSTQHSSRLEMEILSVLDNLSQSELTIFVEYMKKFNPKLQTNLARNFVLAIRKLDDNSLKIVETLLNNEVEYEALSKLVEMLSNVAEEHKRDKNFGKLLMNVIEILGPNLLHLELPLKHIIAGHRSVWKSKLEKKFTTCYEDSMLFSQSFRG